MYLAFSRLRAGRAACHAFWLPAQTLLLGFRFIGTFMPDDQPQDQRLAQVRSFLDANADFPFLLGLRSKVAKRSAIRN